MSKAATVRAIYKCVLRDAVELQRTPHYCLRPKLRLEEWGSGHYKPTLETHVPQQELPFRPLLATVSSLEQAEAIRDGGSFTERHVNAVESVKQAFRRHSCITEPQVGGFSWLHVRLGAVRVDSVCVFGCLASGDQR